MEIIGNQSVWSFCDDGSISSVKSYTEVRKASGHEVLNFLELATRIAELQFANRGFALLFRGQSEDHLNSSRNTTLKPSLFRAINGINPSSEILIQRFELLKEAERLLVDSYSEYDRDGIGQEKALIGLGRLKRNQIMRWSILQHYGVCDTPLLDVTQSLRIAASFAADDQKEEAFIFVIGVPNLSGGITTCIEAGLQIVRLSSVCPPAALRPHIQEGYLLGEYPEMDGYEQKENYDHYEVDFGRRLVAKFRFNPSTFWKNDDVFPQVNHDALYPSPASDPLCKIAEDVKQKLNQVN